MSSSNVGNASTYEAGDQRNMSNDEKRGKENEQGDNEQRFHEGKPNSHKAQDSSMSASSSFSYRVFTQFGHVFVKHPLTYSTEDERSIANKLERETKREGDIAESEDSEEVKALKKDPTAPAKMHGNEPSKGAKIDLQLQLEEEAELKKKGKA